MITKSDFKDKVTIPGDITVNRLQVWECKIGVVSSERLYAMQGADYPMRQAVTDAFMLLFGEAPNFLFSGWNADLTDGEIDYVLEKKQ